jgi:hypothetical protein
MSPIASCSWASLLSQAILVPTDFLPDRFVKVEEPGTGGTKVEAIILAWFKKYLKDNSCT